MLSDVSCHGRVIPVSTNINQMLPPPYPEGVCASVLALHRVWPQMEELGLDGTPSCLTLKKCWFVSTGFSNQEAHRDLGTSSLMRFNELFNICVAGKCMPLGTWEEITEASHYVDF